MKTNTLKLLPLGFLALLLTFTGSLYAETGSGEVQLDEGTAPSETMAFPAADPEYLQGIQDWNAMNAKQGPACAIEHEARQVLLGKKKVATVILLHGYSQSPKAMDEYLQFFSSLDVNILVPRLSHHFNPDISDLDSVTFNAWLKQMRETVQIAKKLGRRIVIVGFSLGGSLATRMALEFPKDISGLILLSPAWRINSRISGGLLVGGATSKNGHDYLGYVPACDLNKSYLSKDGGTQVQKLAADNEDRFKGAYPGVDGTAIRQLDMPMLTAIMEDDNVIDSRMAREMFSPIDGGYHTLLVFPGIDHSLLTTPSAASCQMFSPELSATPFAGGNLIYQIHEFVREVLGIRTDVLKLGKDFIQEK